MFTLSRKSDYGLLLLSLLMRKRENEREKKRNDFVSLSLISQETQLPYAFLSRIASQLAQTGLLRSKEGVFGGYKLTKKAEDVSLAQVIEVFDGPWAPTRCTWEEEECQYEKVCPLAHHWKKYLKAKMWDLLNSYTLKDLIS